MTVNGYGEIRCGISRKDIGWYILSKKGGAREFEGIVISELLETVKNWSNKTMV